MIRFSIAMVLLGVLASGCKQTPPPDPIVVDNSDPLCVVEGEWLSETEYPHYGDDYLFARVPDRTGGPISVTWNAEIPKSGDYEVFLRWPAENPAGLASNALYLLEHAQGVYSFRVNQQQVPLANTWVSAGTHPFKKRGTAKLVLSNEGADHNVAADAVKWVYQAD